MEKLIKTQYLNLLTDFAFKYIFAKEENKILLIHLLNAIIGKEEKIKDIRYLRSEQLGRRAKERKAVYDIYCINERGELLIIEMQVGKQTYFMDRCLYYSTFPVQSQAKRGKWNFKLQPVYFIGILDFIHDESNNRCINRYSLMNEEDHTKISDKLNFITVELPKFNKPLKALENDLDAWLFCFRNLPELKKRPEKLKGTVFDLLFEIAAVNNLTTEDMEVYAKSVAEYEDVQLMMECSRDEGMKKGMKKGIEKGIVYRNYEIARNMLERRVPVKDIAEITGLTPQQILEL
jgi:predicted transposase/invertase (TIGR01784 family)